jgi:hypothetical protein
MSGDISLIDNFDTHSGGRFVSVQWTGHCPENDANMIERKVVVSKKLAFPRFDRYPVPIAHSIAITSRVRRILVIDAKR